MNDVTVTAFAEAAVLHGEAGAGIIAPSGMMDHTVGGIRASLDAAGSAHTALMA